MKLQRWFMSENLLDLSGKIEPDLVELFQAVENVAAASQICYFVVGATARDIILHYGYDVPIKRATADTDLGVEVPSWDEFQTLKQELTSTGLFRTTRASHRLIYKRGLPLDIVPFGSLEHPDKEITWPPDNSVKMNVLGFEDAYRNTQNVRLSDRPILDIPFATPAGLAVLKIIAWQDRSSDGSKDAQDLVYLMSNYTDAGNQERLFRDHGDLLDVDDFDYVRSGIQLLGRDMARMMLPGTRDVVLRILDHEIDGSERHHLVEDMMQNVTASEELFEMYLGFLKALKKGIQDVMPEPVERLDNLHIVPAG